MIRRVFADQNDHIPASRSSHKIRIGDLPQTDSFEDLLGSEWELTPIDRFRSVHMLDTTRGNQSESTHSDYLSDPTRLAGLQFGSLRSHSWIGLAR